MIFQEPMTSLNPVFTIGDQITETLFMHREISRKDARARAVELLQLVGLPDPERRLDQYPHQFSGGMRQRVMIAIGLACDPKLIIADEPTTALDVTIQAQILKLMKDLSRRLNIALIIITHNLGVVARYADRVNVMYAGRMIERGTAEDIFVRPLHPYTIGLLRSVPRLDRPRTNKLQTIEGLPPSLLDPPPGCRFAPLPSPHRSLHGTGAAAGRGRAGSFLRLHPRPGIGGARTGRHRPAPAGGVDPYSQGHLPFEAGP